MNSKEMKFNIMGFIIVLLGIALYLFVIMPETIDEIKLDPFIGTHYAHRGLFGDPNIVPENSLLAFQSAIDYGYGVELDVHLSKDNIPIVFHDYDLKRVCNIDRQVNDLDSTDLQSLNLFNSDEKIPNLQQALSLINGQVPLIVELKGDSINSLLSKTVAELLDNYEGDYVVQSFNPFLLRWFKKNRPEIIRGQLAQKMSKKGKSISKRGKYFAGENLLSNIISKPNFIAFNHDNQNMFSFNLVKKLYKPLTVGFTIKSQEILDDNIENFNLFIFDEFVPVL